MQDRFKFRGLTKANEWIYGSLLWYADEPQIWDKDGNNFIVKPESVGQCTGLKDKHGKLIYDLDCLQIKNTRYLIKMNIFNISLTNILTGDIIYLKDNSITSRAEIEGNYYECDTEISENSKRGIN